MSGFKGFEALVAAHVWQSVLVAAVLALILILGRRMSGAARYAVSAVALLACIALPVAVMLPGGGLADMLAQQIEEMAPAPKASEEAAPVIHARGGEVSISAPAPFTAPKRERAAPVEATAATAPASEAEVIAKIAAPKAPAWRMPEVDLRPFLLPLALVWALGAILMLARTGRDLVAAERLVARARPVQMKGDMARRLAGVRVAISADAPGPMAVGLFQPSIILPESMLDRICHPDMAGLLEHERAHIERRDMAVALGQRVLLALMWWSPAMHWISRRMDEEREVACDEAAVAHTGDAKAFALTLTGEAQTQLWARVPRLAVGAIGKPSQFGKRIRRLIEMARTGGAPARYSGRLAFSGLALAIVAAVFFTPRIIAEPRNQDEPSPPPADRALAGGPSSRDADASHLDAALSDLDQQIRDLNDAHGDLGVHDSDLDADLAGLSSELAGLGAEIGVLVSQQVLGSMPLISDEVRADLEREGIHLDGKGGVLLDYDGQKLTPEQFAARIQRDIEPELKGLRIQLTEQERDQMRRDMDAARAEVRHALEDMRDRLRDQEETSAEAREAAREGLEEARSAMEDARRQLAEARARGDFAKFDKDAYADVIAAAKEAARNAEKYRQDYRVAIGGASSSERDLYNAAEWGDVAAVKKLLADGVDPNRIFRGDGTALIAATRRGRTDVVKLLLDGGADANLGAPGDGNALIMAVRSNRADITKLLLKSGADANASVPGDGTPLIAAARKGNVDLVKLLLENGADPDKAAPGDGNPLIMAAMNGCTDTVKMLLKAGADVNAYVPGDETALINAAREGELDAVKLLVEAGADVNQAYRSRGEYRSPLGQAVRLGHDDVAKYLRAKGAMENPGARN